MWAPRCLKPTGASPPAAAETAGAQQDERAAALATGLRLPQNCGSALLYSRALPHTCRPASNLGSNAKEWGRSSCFLRQSVAVSSPLTPWCPWCRAQTVALISLILEQYRGVFERIYIFSPSVVKKYIKQDLGVNTEREQTYWDERRCGASSSTSARSRRRPRSWK